MSKLAVLVAMVLVCIFQAESKVYTRCELVKDLRKHGFPESKMRDWVCLIEAESGRNTKAKNTNTNGSTDYGLFQINSGYWCNKGSKPGKDCNIKCADLLSDDITKAVNCAKKIYKRHGFNAWYGWKNKCKGRPLPNISKC